MLESQLYLLPEGDVVVADCGGEGHPVAPYRHCSHPGFPHLLVGLPVLGFGPPGLLLAQLSLLMLIFLGQNALGY